MFGIGGNKPDFRTNAERTARLSNILAELSGAANSDTLLKQAEAAVTAYKNAKVKLELEKLEVTELNRNKLGIRVSTLKAAGYKTIWDISAAKSKDIFNISGIGEDSAAIILGLTAEIKKEVENSTVADVSPDDDFPEAYSLVRTLYAMRKSEELRPALSEFFDAWGRSAESLAETSGAACSKMAWLISSEAARKEAAAAADEVSALLKSDGYRQAEELLSAYKNVCSIPGEYAMEDFRANPIPYYTLLESVAGSGIKSEDFTGNLSVELSAEVETETTDFDGLKCTLRNYQSFGVRYILRQKAVLLGDEMGLGKTVQAIAAMVSVRNNGGTHFMVVCPAGVLINWMREITQHSDLNPIKIHGNDSLAMRKWLREGGVAVTTYESISCFSLPEDFRISMLVVDEAHYIKNPYTIRTRAAIHLRERTDRVLFMTGTPLENRAEEMLFLISCLQPELVETVKASGTRGGSVAFRQLLAPVYLRRTREAVLTELPELTEMIEYCELNAKERNRYETFVMARSFMDMRRVSWNAEDIKDSSKAARMKELCEEAMEDGRKIIVFSFFLETLRRVKQVLGDCCYGPLTGSVSPLNRQKMIDDFGSAEGGAVLAAQIQAGGTGMNIQCASVIIICEPQIKPSIENQAISRAYRMGQTRNVLVYRLVCPDTVDEHIMEILSDKQAEFDAYADESYTGEESLKLNDWTQNKLIDAEIARITG